MVNLIIFTQTKRDKLGYRALNECVIDVIIIIFCIYSFFSVRKKYACMYVYMHVCVSGLQREDYCRFTRPGNNEQTHPRDTYSISITMKCC